MERTMKKTLWTFLLLLLLLSLGACSAKGDAEIGNTEENKAAPAFRTISAEEAYQMMAESPNFILIDVRTESEYREGRIEDAILIPNDEIEARAKAELPDKDQLIFVYCRSGVRSANAAGTLAGMGYSNVYNMGGIIDWPYEIIRD